LIQTIYEVVPEGVDIRFQCPSGHFLIQTKETAGSLPGGFVSMPVRAFLDSDFPSLQAAVSGKYTFQCPSGHFLIQTLCRGGNYRLRGRVSMPVRAFLDSDSI